MPQPRNPRSKAATVAAVAAFLLAALTGLALRGDGSSMTDENMSFWGVFTVSAVFYFILSYMLTLLAVGLFKDNKTEE